MRSRFCFFIVNFGIAFILSAVLSFHYKKFGTVIANREQLARIFPFIALTTFIFRRACASDFKAAIEIFFGDIPSLMFNICSAKNGIEKYVVIILLPKIAFQVAK